MYLSVLKVFLYLCYKQDVMEVIYHRQLDLAKRDDGGDGLPLLIKAHAIFSMQQRQAGIVIMTAEVCHS